MQFTRPVCSASAHYDDDHGRSAGGAAAGARNWFRFRVAPGRWASPWVGGLLLSQALTLYTTPVIYIFFDNLAQRFGHKSNEPGAGDAEQAGPV